MCPRIRDNDGTKTALRWVGDEGLAARRFRRSGEERTKRKGRDLSQPDGWPYVRARMCAIAHVFTSIGARAPEKICLASLVSRQ